MITYSVGRIHDEQGACPLPANHLGHGLRLRSQWPGKLADMVKCVVCLSIYQSILIINLSINLFIYLSININLFLFLSFYINLHIYLIIHPLIC